MWRQRLQRWWLQSSWPYTSYIVLCQLWWSSFWRNMLLMTIASDDVSSGALLQTQFFRRILLDASKLQIKFLCSWTCSIRIFMNSTLIMDLVHLNKLFSKSNWWFLIPCYYQNSIGDIVKHPLFQQKVQWLIPKSGVSAWSDHTFKLTNKKCVSILYIKRINDFGLSFLFPTIPLDKFAYMGCLFYFQLYP